MNWGAFVDEAVPLITFGPQSEVVVNERAVSTGVRAAGGGQHCGQLPLWEVFLFEQSAD